MAQPAPQITRPAILYGVVAGLAGAVVLAAGGFAALGLSLLERPVVVLTDPDRLGAALEKAPWVSDAEEGVVIWAVSAPSCAACASFVEHDIPALEADGYAVRLILVAPADASPADLARVVEMARAREGADSELEPGEADGYVAWGREAAAEIDAVLSANGSRLELPALIWRRGAEWRVSLGRDLGARARIAADLKPAA